MLAQINGWIDETLASYEADKMACDCFATDFEGYYTPEFLAASFYVVVPQLPKPDFPELRQLGFGDLIDADFNGITYKNTYFVKQGKERNPNLHFHELVHVVQWQILGAEAFIIRYMDEILQYGYEDAPLEKMAYALEDHFLKGGPPLDIRTHVQQKI
jgi:hypothetical protein